VKRPVLASYRAVTFRVIQKKEKGASMFASRLVKEARKNWL
jgi:hypothetical protein